MPDPTREEMAAVIRREIAAREDALPPPHRRNTRSAKEYIRDLDAFRAALRELEAGGRRVPMTNTPTPDRAPADAQPSEEALHEAKAIARFGMSPEAERLVALALDRFRAAGVREERERHGHCPECGCSDFVYLDDGDDQRTCEECGHVG